MNDIKFTHVRVLCYPESEVILSDAPLDRVIDTFFAEQPEPRPDETPPKIKPLTEWLGDDHADRPESRIP